MKLEYNNRIIIYGLSKFKVALSGPYKARLLNIDSQNYYLFHYLDLDRKIRVHEKIFNQYLLNGEIKFL